MSASIERLALQTAALRREETIDDGLVSFLTADGPLRELIDRLSDHERLLHTVDETIADADVPVIDGSIDEQLAVARALVEVARGHLASLTSAETDVADRERRALDDLRRCDAVGLG